MNSPLLELREVSKSYSLGGRIVTVLDKVSLSFAPAQRVTIMGASGSGKTTLLQLLGGLDTPDSGEIFWQGRSLSTHEPSRWRGSHVGFVFQAYQLFPELSALENVELPLRIQRQSGTEQARHWLARVGLEHRLHHRPAELSGGEQQRVALARALCPSPQVLLADEPTGNLDRATGEQVMKLLLELTVVKGLTLILVTHDPSIAALGERRLRLEAGKLLEVMS